MKTCKLNLELTAEASALLDGLAEQMGTTKAGVLRSGLSLMALARREAERGNALAVTREGAVLKEIIGSWSPAMA